MNLQQNIQLQLSDLLRTVDRSEITKLNITILKQLVSEFDRRPNKNIDLTDDQVIRIINKYIKNEQEMMTFYTDENTEEYKNTKHSIELLNKFLPKKPSKQDILNAIESVIPNILETIPPERMKFMGKIMKVLNNTVDGNDVKNLLLNYKKEKQ